MKEYKVDVIDLIFKSKKKFETIFQELVDERVSQGYTLHSFEMHLEFCTAVFEREITEKDKG